MPRYAPLLAIGRDSVNRVKPTLLPPTPIPTNVLMKIRQKKLGDRLLRVEERESSCAETTVSKKMEAVSARFIGYRVGFRVKG